MQWKTDKVHVPFKERNCSVSIVLDSRTRRKNAYEFPLSLRFTIDRKFFYLTVGSSFTEKKFSDICNATKCKSENYKLQKEWKDTITPKYKDILTNLNKGGILTFEWYVNVSWAKEWCFLMRTQQRLNPLLVYGSKSFTNYAQTTVECVLPQQRAMSVRSNHSERYSEQMWSRDSVSVPQKSRNGKRGCTME